MTQFLSEFDPAALWMVGLGAFLLLAALVAWRVRAGRQRRREIRQIVQCVEDLRSGNPRVRPEIGTHSPMALVSDAVQRLGQDLATKWREAEETGFRLGAVMDAVQDVAVISTGKEGEIQTMSPGAAALFDMDEAEAADRSLESLFDEQAWKDFLPQIALRTLPEEGIDTRVVMRRQNGELFDAQLDLRALTGRGQEMLGYLIVVRDVSAQTRLEAELRASEERYRSLVEGLSEGVFILQQGRLVYVNPSLAELCGSTPDAMLGGLWRDYVVSRDVLLVQERLVDLEDRAGERVRLHVTLRGGEARPAAEVRLDATSILYAGEPAVLVTVEDETAERRVESELSQTESQLDALLESATDGVLVLADGPEGGVVQLTNHAFLGMFGLGEREVLGVSGSRLMRMLRERGGGAEQVAAFLAARAVVPRSETVSLTAPRRIDVELTVAALTDRSGAPLGRVLVFRDRTAQHASERVLELQAERLRASKESLEQAYRSVHELNDQLESRTGELAKLNAELRALDKMKTELLGNVSHELQTPLVSIRGYTEMIMKGRLGAITQEQRKGLQLSLKNIDRMISMIDSLLAIPRLDEEVGKIKLSSFPLEGVIEEALASLSERLAAKRIEFSCRFDPPRPTVHGDREMILRVFVNLLGNAIKFNREGGKVEVLGSSGKPGFLKLEVRDDGVGIPEEDLERIFERHFRSASGEAEEGTGLGLSIVRDLLRLHGCSIRAESRQGQGSRFFFTLPLAEASGQRPNGGPVSGKGHAADPATGATTAAERDSGVPERRDEPDDEPPTRDGSPPPRLRIIRHPTP